ncbi:MAG TPA: D-2-hydroxyacid dehydrogenase [Aequorivita sp.]|nr:D-2-hydroxyacid dehydrogenase [Aequorivita sp.]
MKILANDGISKSGIKALEAAGHEVMMVNVAQEQLENFINEHKIEALLVRSATQVRKNLIDNCPTLKVIGRGGVGMDNIDVSYAKENGLKVINTPSASSSSVAELVFGHLFGGVRYLHDSNRNMPLDGDSHFKDLKKSYSAGSELRGKTLGIIGFGKIGEEVAKIALGCGMKVISTRKKSIDSEVTLTFFDGQKVTLPIENVSMDKLLSESDFITLHIPASAGRLIGKEEISKMKDGVGIINTSRGGLVSEEALLDALEAGKVSFAALDVYEGEPSPSIRTLMNHKISLSPHIGAATLEAQDRIGTELAAQIINLSK